MTDTTLKSCPFCGSHAVLLYDTNRRQFDMYVPICSNLQCKAQMPSYCDEFSAIAAWNQRV
jgi:Lar family restriction alleviation protein